MSVNCLSLLSVNVKGIREKVKRRSIFEWCKCQKADIVFLQESHITKEVRKDFDLDWGEKGFHSYGTNKSRGVSIYFGDPKVQISQVIGENEGDGRKLLINCQIGKTFLTLVNVYAPNNATERNTFLINLAKWIDENKQSESETTLEREVIVGGDCNSVVNNGMDKKGGRQTDTGNSSQTLKNFYQSLGLCDIWRERNKTTRQYTYRDKFHKVSSRLDYWFISKTIADSVVRCDIRPSIKTDHRAIFL